MNKRSLKIETLMKNDCKCFFSFKMFLGMHFELFCVVFEALEVINLSFHHDFFFGIRSAKLKKNKKIKNFIGRDVNNHIDLERAKKDY